METRYTGKIPIGAHLLQDGGGWVGGILLQVMHVRQTVIAKMYNQVLFVRVGL